MCMCSAIYIMLRVEHEFFVVMIAPILDDAPSFERPYRCWISIHARMEEDNILPYGRHEE